MKLRKLSGRPLLAIPIDTTTNMGFCVWSDPLPHDHTSDGCTCPPENLTHTPSHALIIFNSNGSEYLSDDFSNEEKAQMLWGFQNIVDRA